MKLLSHFSKTIRSTERGQSMVELGVGFVFLATLMAGMIDFGLAFVNFVAMRDAAQEGAVYGAVHPTSCTQIESYARESAEALMANVQIDVLIDGVPCASATASQACAKKEIRVAVSQPHYPITMPFVGSVLSTPNEINLRAEIKDTILTPKCP